MSPTANGVTGSAGAAPAPAAAVEEEPASDPRFDAAFDAVERGDWAGARAAYQAVLAQSPADPDAAAGLAQVALLERTDGVDPVAALRAAARPDDLDAQLLAADVEVLQGDAAAGFDRLIDAVRRTSGAEREAVRQHLLGLFAVVGPGEPAVGRARTGLANALF